MDDKWINYFTGELTKEEKEDLFSRLANDEKEKEEFSRIHNTWALMELLPQQNDDELAYKGEKLLIERRQKKSFRYHLVNTLKYAAILCIVFISGWYLSTLSSKMGEESFTEIEVPNGQRVHVAFSDGSSVWLSPNTRMKMPNEFRKDTRLIELDGEGFFSVTEDKKRPFIVKSKGYNVEVLGTRFNVFSYLESPKYEICLTEGSVHVYNEKNKENGVILAPDEKAMLVDNLLVKTTSNYSNEEFLASGIYNFQATPFIEILDYLGLWYNVRFQIRGVVLMNTKVNAKFRQSDDIENILTALQNVFQFRFTRLDDKTIEIYK